MQGHRVALAALVVFAAAVTAQTPIEVQPVKELEPTGSLGTCGYKPTEAESPFFARLSNAEKTNGGMLQRYSIHGKTGTYVAWFGIVRGITAAAEPGGGRYASHSTPILRWRNRLPHHAGARTGDGDFTAKLKVDHQRFPRSRWCAFTADDRREGTACRGASRLHPGMAVAYVHLHGPDGERPHQSAMAEVLAGERHECLQSLSQG